MSNYLTGTYSCIKAQPIVFKERLLKTSQAKEISFDILSGGGNYSLLRITTKKSGTWKEEKLDSLTLDSDKNSKKEYLSTGKITARHSKEGNYNIEIQDRFGQRANAVLMVKDAELRLSDYDVNMSGYKSYFVTVYDSYGKIKVLQVNNKKISTRLVKKSDGTQGLDVEMLKAGRSVITLIDEEGTTKKIVVYSSDKYKNADGEEDKEEKEETGNVRYIRDWVGISDSRINTHWIEIQAIERGSSENVALQKNLTAKNPETNSQRPYNFILDGNISGGNWAEGGTGQNHITVDLGKVYDIEKVKVWHYYPDGGSGRIYNGTKTEVSVDGKNWTVLFDSAVSGTYVEPKDGSGRSYDVERVEENIGISNVQFGEKEQGSSKIPYLEFETIGKIKEVGVVSKNEEGEYVRDKFDITEDGKYYIAFLGDVTDNGYIDFTPYIVGTDGRLLYYKKEKLLSYNDSGIYLTDNSTGSYINKNDKKYTEKYNKVINGFISLGIKYKDYSFKKGTLDGLGAIVLGYQEEDIDVSYFDNFRSSKRNPSDSLTEVEIYIGKGGIKDISTGETWRDSYFKEDFKSFAGMKIESRWNSDQAHINQYDSDYLKSYLGIIGYFLEYNKIHGKLTNDSIKPITHDHVHETLDKYLASYNNPDNRCFVNGQEHLNEGKGFRPRNDEYTCITEKGVYFDRYKKDLFGFDAFECNEGFGYNEESNLCESLYLQKEKVNKQLERIKGLVEKDDIVLDDKSLAELKELAERHNSSLDIENFSKGLAKGSYQALEDYVTSTIEILTWKELFDLAAELSKLSIEDLQNGVEEGIKSELEDIATLIEISTNIEAVMVEVDMSGLGIPEEEALGYGTGYMGVSLGTEFVPVLKPLKIIRKLKGVPHSDFLGRLKVGNNKRDRSKDEDDEEEEEEEEEESGGYYNKKCAVKKDKRNIAVGNERIKIGTTKPTNLNTWFLINKMSYSEMISCSDRIKAAAKGSLFETWVKKNLGEADDLYKHVNGRANRHTFLGESGKNRSSDAVIHEDHKDIVIDMKNYQEASTINKTQLSDYLNECNEKNGERKDRFGNVLPDAAPEMGLRYIFSIKPGRGSLNVFESAGWNEYGDENIDNNYKECESREIYYYNDSGTLKVYND